MIFYSANDGRLKAIGKIPPELPPDFIVCPDKPAKGLESLEFSMEWQAELPPQYTYYLPVQDGMTTDDVARVIDSFGGLFVGGTKKWKLQTAKQWVELAHEHGIECHVGRISSLQDLLFCQKIGVDSVDSSTWAQATGGWRVARHLYARIDALIPQTELDIEGS